MTFVAIDIDGWGGNLYSSSSFRNAVEMRAKLYILMFLSLSFLVGCERWYAHDSIETVSWQRPVMGSFQRLRMLPDSVMLEIAVVKIERSEMEGFDKLWKQLDHSPLSLRSRKRLDQNGLRAAVVSSHVPAELHRLMEPVALDESKFDQWQQQLFDKGLLKPEPRILLHDGIQNRRGESHPVPVSGYMPHASWVVEVDQQRIAGASENVRAVFEVKTYPKGDGTVRLVCTPGLHIGQPKTQIGIQQQAFAYETSQEKKLLKSLKFEACVRSGESLIIAPTSDMADLGGLFFGSEIDTQLQSNDGSYRVLMVRLLQTQMDDLFDSSPELDDLTTTFVE